jgi:hypothetical protein
MSSGTTSSIANALQNDFLLEVGHDVKIPIYDPGNIFVRDGDGRSVGFMAFTIFNNRLPTTMLATTTRVDVVEQLCRVQ